MQGLTKGALSLEPDRFRDLADLALGPNGLWLTIDVSASRVISFDAAGSMRRETSLLPVGSAR